jgi:hypothetical protein
MGALKHTETRRHDHALDLNTFRRVLRLVSSQIDTRPSETRERGTNDLLCAAVPRLNLRQETCRRRLAIADCLATFDGSPIVVLMPAKTPSREIVALPFAVLPPRLVEMASCVAPPASGGR